MISTLVAFAVLAQQPQDDGYMRWANYNAGSHKEDVEAPGGFSVSDNYPAPVHPVRSSGRFRVLLTIQSPGVGELKVTNQMPNEMVFTAQDSALPIVQEARDAKGVWRPVEFRPISTCGNSYHRLFLPSNHEWTFPAVLDTKGTKTKIRARLLTDSGPVYSNEIDGFVTPSRFKLPVQWSEHYEMREVDGIFRIAMKQRAH